MIQESRVSSEVAKLLRDKGFDEPCHYYYRNNTLMFDASLSGRNSYQHSENIVSAPTHQMTKAWLRKKHNLFIQVEYDAPTFSADIYKMDEVDEYGSAKHIPPTFANAKSYEEADDTAIKYAIEKLI